MTKLRFLRLWDSYSGLLTATQREITDLYLNFDLTLSEIADQKGITRQAVNDCLAGCKKQLEEYEEKLKFIETGTVSDLQTSFMTTDALKWAKATKEKFPELRNEIEELEKILNKDYSAEAEEAFAARLKNN